MTTTTQTTETYGIHLLKVAAIMLQVLAHSYLWSVQQGLLQISNLGTFFNHSSYIVLSSALFLPMTAGAVMRLLATVHDDRVVNIDWRGVWALSLGLALLESTKQALMYHGGGFFSWNVLHLIAISIPFMLWLASISIRLVWSVGLAILLATPAVFLATANLPPALNLPTTLLNLPLKATVLAVLFSLLLLPLLARVANSASMRPKHKVRASALLLVLWVLALYFCWQLKPSAAEHIELATLPLGLLVGGDSGIHMWAFFPWAGSILLGFGVFDWLVKTKASARLLWLLAAVGAALIIFFQDRYIYEVTSSLSATAFFSGYHFNRLPEKMLLVIGLFLLCVPVFIWLARRGCETPFVVLLSRYVLWLYILQTTVLMLVPGWVQQLLGQYLGNIGCMLVATALSVALALLLPLLLQKLPLNLRLQLQRSR